EAFALWIIGFNDFATGDLHEARKKFEASMELARSAGDTLQISRTLTGLAEVARAGGDFSRALHLVEEVLALHRARGDISGTATDLTNLSMTTISLGRLDRARTCLIESIELGDKLGRKGHRIGELCCAAGLAMSRSEWERAARFLGAMQAICE